MLRKGIGTPPFAPSRYEVCEVSRLGHPYYYSRFDFARASEYGLGNEYNADDSFMALEFKEGIFDRVSGMVRFGSEFMETGC